MGEVRKVRLPPRKDALYYIVINPYDKILLLFKDKESFPKFPKETILLSKVKRVRKLEKN